MSDSDTDVFAGVVIGVALVVGGFAILCGIVQAYEWWNRRRTEQENKIHDRERLEETLRTNIKETRQDVQILVGLVKGLYQKLEAYENRKNESRIDSQPREGSKVEA